MLQKRLEFNQVHNLLEKRLGRYILSRFVTLLYRYLLVLDEKDVLDTIFMCPEVTVGLTLFFHVHVYIVHQKIKNLPRQSDYYDQLSVVSGLLQKPFTYK